MSAKAASEAGRQHNSEEEKELLLMVVVVEEGTCAHTNTNTLGARLKSTIEVPLRGAAAAETVVGE